MPVVVAVHRLKNFDEWLKIFKANPPPKVGRWRLLRGSEDRNRVHDEFRRASGRSLHFARYRTPIYLWRPRVSTTAFTVQLLLLKPLDVRYS